MSSARLRNEAPGDRPLFLFAAIAFAAFVLLGFAQSYYLKGFLDRPPLPSPLVHVHGIIMTAWVALFVSQVWLIRSGRVAVHRMMGAGGVVLAILIVIIGFYTALGMGRNCSTSIPAGIPPLAFMAIPMFDLLMFSGFVATAVLMRKQPANHKRLMLLSALTLLPPTLGRFPVPSAAALGPLLFFGLPALLTIVAVAYDSVHHRRINRAFAIGGLLLIVSFPLRMMIMGTESWMRLAKWLTQG